MRADAQNTVVDIEKSLELLRQRLDWDTAEFRLEEFNARVEDPDLWNDPDAAQKLMQERQALVDAMGTYTSIKQELSDQVEMIELGEMEEDEDVVAEAEEALNGLPNSPPRKSWKHCWMAKLIVMTLSLKLILGRVARKAAIGRRC